MGCQLEASSVLDEGQLADLVLFVVGFVDHLFGSRVGFLFFFVFFVSTCALHLVGGILPVDGHGGVLDQEVLQGGSGLDAGVGGV